MTIQHLLCHTAGLTYGGFLPGLELPVDAAYASAGISRNSEDSLTSFVEKLSQVPLLYDPGTRWSYSIATDVCGHLVELISGQPFESFLKERLFEPLGMLDTAFTVSDASLNRFAACYERSSNGTLKLQDNPVTSNYRSIPGAPSGAGGLVGTIDDYSKFCSMLLQGGSYDGHQLIGRATLDLMTRNHLVGGSSLAKMAMGGFSETANDGVGFGLGFASTIDPIASGTVGLGDFYWGGLASTLFWVDPIEEFYVIFMTQLIPSSTFNFRGQLKNIIYGALY